MFIKGKRIFLINTENTNRLPEQYYFNLSRVAAQEIDRRGSNSSELRIYKTFVTIGNPRSAGLLYNLTDEDILQLMLANIITDTPFPIYLSKFDIRKINYIVGDPFIYVQDIKLTNNIINYTIVKDANIKRLSKKKRQQIEQTILDCICK